jgi:nucleotide-binding universal stress UspA family protein
LFKILAAVDNSRYASVVMETVSRLSSYVESEVTILSAVKPKRYRISESSGEDEKTMKEFHEHLMHKFFPQNLLAFEARSDHDPELFPTRGATVHSKVVQGDPADSICDYAEEMNADLVVVGKRGGGNIGALLLGSVSERVVHKCARSVLVAKGERLDHTTLADTSSVVQSHSRPISYKR